jgi:hypothetical protein
MSKSATPPPVPDTHREEILADDIEMALERAAKSGVSHALAYAILMMEARRIQDAILARAANIP